MIEYIWPSNTIAKVIVVALVVFAVYWGLKLCSTWSKWRRYTRIVNRLTDTNDLQSARLQRIDGKEAVGAYWTNHQLDDSYELREHLETIYSSGLEGSPITPQQVISKTVTKLRKQIDFLRVTASLFIVIGLLGTLLGLSDSLAGLPKILDNGSEQALTVDSITKNLGMMLESLRGAFAPSVLGVFFTVLSVFAIGLLSYLVFSPLVEAITNWTVEVLAPVLLPSTSERIQMERHATDVAVDTITKHTPVLVDAIQGIEQKSNDLTSKIQQAEESLVVYSKQAENLANTAESFSNAVQHLGSHQDEIKTITEDIRKTMETLDTTMSSTTDDLKTIIDGHGNQLTDYNDALKNHSNLLESAGASIKEVHVAFGNLATKLDGVLEDIEKRAGVEKKTRETLESINKAIDQITLVIAKTDDRTREITHKAATVVANELTNSVGTELSKIDKTMSERLDKITRIVGPIEAAAQRFDNVEMNVTNRTEKFTKELQSEFFKLAKVTEEQIKSLNGTDNRVEKLLISLDSGVGILDQNIGALSKSLKEYRDAVDSQERRRNWEPR